MTEFKWVNQATKFKQRLEKEEEELLQRDNKIILWHMLKE